jgi:hypothetical protein
MSNSFTSNSGIKSFGVFSEPLEAGEYIYNKKSRASFCAPSHCPPNLTQGNLLMFKNSYQMTYFPCKNAINKANLNINLITHLNLKDVPVVTHTGSNVVPITLSSTAVPYLDYNIDPSGNLFGNSVCGINNYVQYMQYNTTTTL